MRPSFKGVCARPSRNAIGTILFAPPFSVWRRSNRAEEQFQLESWGQDPERRGDKPPNPSPRHPDSQCPTRPAERRQRSGQLPRPAPPPAPAIGGSERRGALSVWMGATGAGAQAQRRGAVEAGGAAGPLSGEDCCASSGPRDLRRAGAGGARLPPAVPLSGKAPPARGRAWGRGRGHPSVAWGCHCGSSVAIAALPWLVGPREVSSEASQGAPRRGMTGRGMHVRGWVERFCVPGLGAACFVWVRGWGRRGGDASEETGNWMRSRWLRCGLLSYCEIFKRVKFESFVP